ncbi:hypothetical protein EHS25_004016 [Saitozyma podzolica]|uniref:Zn(2)-C6 fungal-type domain-containing protein n=1 Tax=Saitozyma podzolica TaxID=1890683 RepID=A0A427YSU8_9TREE|nr:hypothetical protein EHS25_004016 [Saitozyma podzolica]
MEGAAVAESSRAGRKAYSCIPCRSRKVKCDRHQVCGQCKRKAIACEWPPNGVPIESEVDAPADYPSPSSASFDPRPSSVAGPSVPASPAQVVDIPHTVALAEQFDHSILNDASEPMPSPNPAPPTSRRRAYPFADVRRRAAGRAADGMVTDALMAALPGRAHADMLLRIYIERVEWIHHPLHLPTFLSQYNKFWAMETDRRKQTVHSRWLAMLFIVLCLGAHFGDHEEDAEEEVFLEACEDSLSHSDFLNLPCTETIQTIICLNLYLNNKDRTSAARSLLGLAIKMAVSIGLSRIPDESSLTDGSGVIERELGRRLWWSLVSQDAYTASTSGFTYLVNLSHASTGRFANVDEEDIRGGSAYHSRPLTETTAATFHIAKIDFALVVRNFIDAINVNFPNARYEDIMELDLRFRQVYERLPTALRPDLPQPFELSSAGSQRYLVEQRIFMGITLHNRIMRLHRAYMLQGYDDPRFEYSTKVCLDSAYALLDLVRQSRQTLCRWWVVLVHVWTSGLIISGDLVRGGQDEMKRQKQRDGVKLAISLLEPISRNSPVALRGVKVLKALLVKSETLKSRKRKRVEMDTGATQLEPLQDASSTSFLDDIFRDVASSDTVSPADTNTFAPDQQSIDFFNSLFEMNFGQMAVENGAADTLSGFPAGLQGLGPLYE